MSNKPHLLFFCETKYGIKSVPNLDRYYHFRQDRDENGKGGGVCIYVDNNTKATAVDIPALNEKDVEQILCVIHHTTR